MPFLKLIELPGASKLGVWENLETDSFFKQHLIINQYDEKALSERLHPLKKSEWLVSRFLIKALLGVKSELILESDGNSKPRLLNHPAKLSISHSNSLAAVIVSMEKRVSVDIEKVHDKVLKIVSRFMHENEAILLPEMDKTLYATIVWSVKETIFKLFPDAHLPFREGISIQSVRFEKDKGSCMVIVNNKGLHAKQKVYVELLKNSNYILTYAYQSN